MKHGISLSLALLMTWLLWSGHYTPWLVALGAISVGVVLVIVRRMDLVDQETAPVQVTLGALPYVPWLAWQVVKANLSVARIILAPALPIAPRVVRVEARQKSAVARALYANSITLTPGTVSIELGKGEITVHALTADTARDVESGEMGRRVCRVEGS